MPVSDVYRKSRAGPRAEQFLATEAAGLHWLRVPGGPPVPEVLELGANRLATRSVAQSAATPAMAADFGRRLATLHAAGAPAFGSAPPTAPGPHGWIGDLPMPYAQRGDFVRFWALDRVARTAKMARDRGGLSPEQAARVDGYVADLLDGQVDTGPPVAPARVHGDLWNGNVLWGADGQVWIIDPAAHGGHAESDLAMLDLFGVPYQQHIVAGYADVTPLAPGWQERVALHQVWPLLVHAALFAGNYGASALRAIDRSRG